MKALGPLAEEKDSSTSQVKVLRDKADSSGGPAWKMRGLEQHLTPVELEVRREEYEKCKREAEEIEQEIAPLLAGIEKIDAQTNDIKKKLKELTDQQTDLKKLTSAPTSILERDATKRAVLWMRKIR